MEHILTTKGTMPKPEIIKGASIPEYIEIKTATGDTVAFLSPRSDGIDECWISDEQNGSCTLEFTLPIIDIATEQTSRTATVKGVSGEATTLAAEDKWQYLTDKYRIYADGKEFVILNPDAVDKQRDGKKLTGKIKAHESWVLLGKKYQTISNDPQNPNPPWGAVIIVSGGAAHGGFEAGSAGSALSYLLNGTGWTVGTVDVTGTYDLETEKESVLYNINQVQEKWGGILIWDSVNKTVSLRDEATYQPYTGYQIRYAKNLKGINRVDDYDIVTRLYPFGENDLNISAVNGGLLYLDNHSYSDDILEGVWYNQDIADQTQLKIAGEKQLAVMCRPRHNYKTEVLDLRSLPGYGHETFKRSDMVDLLDEDFGANARVRIIRYRHNVFQPWLCDMELGDPIEKIQATVAQTVLMAKFYKNVVAPNTSFQNLLKAFINTAATEINGANGDYTLVDGVSTWFDRDNVTGELTGKLVRITPQGLIISYDGGQTWKLAISGEGIHADAGWVGKLDAGVVTIGAETTFAEGYDPTKNGMGVDADCLGLWHFDGSLNSHKGVAVDSDALFGGGCFGQALSIATGKHLKVPTTDMLASAGAINFRAKNLSASANGSVLVDLPKSDNTQGLQVGISSVAGHEGEVYIVDSVSTVYGLNKSTLTVWDSISLAWKSDRLSLVVNDTEACYIETPGLPTSLGSYLYIGTDRNGANAINTLVDELRIDKVYREVNIRAGWHKTGVPFYTSEDMKQWPGYLRAETDGLKVYDSSNALRVLVGSWLKDQIRKYGIKIIDGEIYSSKIRSGTETATDYIAIDAGYEPFRVVKGGNNALTVWVTGDAGMIQFFDTSEGTNGEMSGQIAPYNDAMGKGLRIHGRKNDGSSRGVNVWGSEIQLQSDTTIDLKTGTTGWISLDAGSNGTIYATAESTTFNGNFNVQGGQKNCIEITQNYGLRALSAIESPEVLLYDRGIANLIEGEVTIQIDPIFLEVIEPDTELTPWQVWVECYGENGVYISEVGENYFIIKERNNGASNNKVIWRFEATRKNYAGIRLTEVVV